MANAWRPIETAPKANDGPVVILFMPDAREPGVDLGYWTEWDDGGNWTSLWSSKEIDCEPTYWMPLPEPPNGN